VGIGGGGRDTLVGGHGDDKLDGGDDAYNLVDYSLEGGTRAIAVNLETGFVEDTYGTIDSLSNVGIVRGTDPALRNEYVVFSSHQDARDTQQHVEAEGRRCLLIAGDVKDSAFCDAAVAQVVAHFGQLDVLVNNAAFQLHADRIEDISDARFDETLRTNLFGYFYMARAAVPHMRRGSAIVMSGSVTGLAGSKHLLDYSATKGAIHAFTKALASNLLDRGIRVNAIAPGPVWTPLNPADQTAEKVAQFGAATDMGRPAQPAELSPAYVFLAAPACSSYITGIVLPVTGSVGE